MQLGKAGQEWQVNATTLSTTGNATIGGNATFSGTTTPKTFAGVRYADQFTGTGNNDIGDKINAAYADLPSSGGQINVPAKSDGTPYNFSTPIVFSTSGKYVLLVGVVGNSGQTGCALNYTPTTATSAITLDYAPASGGGYTSNHGLVNIVLQNNGSAVNFGSGSSATGIAIGNVNGGAGHALFLNCRVSGFGTGFLKTNPTSWGQKFDNCSFAWNTTGVSLSGNENDTFHNCEISVNSTGVVLASSEATFFGGSIDSNNIAGVNATGGVGTPWASFHGVHFENLGVASATSTHYLTGSSNWQLFGGVMLNDNATGTADYYISAQGNNISIYGTQFQSTGQTVTCVVSLAGGSGALRGIVAGINISPTTGITTIVDTTSSGRLVNVTDFTIVGGNSNAQTPWKLQPSLQLYEQAAPSGVLNSDFLWADSTAHRLKMNNNSGGAVQIVAAGQDISTADQVVATHLTVPLAGDSTSGSAARLTNNNFVLTSDFTTASSTAFQVITGLSWTLAANLAQNVSFECDLMVSQATAVSDSFGIQAATFNPTRIDAQGWFGTATTTQTFGNLANLNTTTATAIVTATPTVATVNGVRLSGVIQNPSNVSTQVCNIMLSQSTAANLQVVKAGSRCRIW